MIQVEIFHETKTNMEHEADYGRSNYSQSEVSKGLNNQLHGICLDGQTYGHQFLKQAQSLYTGGNSLFSDVSIVLGEERIPAHRIFLASWSPKYALLLMRVTISG
jgi:hypothetical protein